MLVLFAVMLTALMGFVGLAVDVGRVELRKLQLQAAADAGALSGADEWGRSNSSWANSARTDARAVATANGLGTVAVASQLTSSTGAYTADYAAVQTVVSQSMPTIFLGLLSSASKTVTVKATAVADPPPCIYFLGDPAAGNGYISVASASMYLYCPAYVRGTPGVDGFSNVRNHQIKSSANLSGAAPGGGSTTYPPFYNYPVLSDPLAYVTLPSFTSCTPAYTNTVVNTTQTLNPGTYCGGLTITGPTAGITVTFNPGLYIITGGANFTNATLSGAEVMLYLTKGGGSGFSTMSSHNTTWNLTAPTSSTGDGRIAGITLCNDRAWIGGWQDFSFVGGSWYADGIIYTTNTGIYDWTFNMTSPNYFGMVTNHLYEFGSTIHPAANYASLTGGNPFHSATSLVQ